MFASTLFTRMSNANPAVKFRYVREGLSIVGDHELGARGARGLRLLRATWSPRSSCVAASTAAIRVGHGRSRSACAWTCATPRRDRARVGRLRQVPAEPEQRSTSPTTTAARLEDYRDKFEEAAREALAEHFEVLSVTFNDPEGQVDAPTPEYGWRVTPYAYVLLKPRGPAGRPRAAAAARPRLPRHPGYAVLPVESAAVRRRRQPARRRRAPVRAPALTQTLDERQAADGKLMLEVKATALGLVPALESLLDVDARGLPRGAISDDHGVSVVKFDEESDAMSNDTFFPAGATLLFSSRRKNKAKAAAAAPRSSSVAKSQSSAKTPAPAPIAARAAGIQPRTPRASASLSARASSSRAMPPVADAREGARLAPTSAAKARRRLRRAAKGNAEAKSLRTRKSPSLKGKSHGAIRAAKAKSVGPTPEQVLGAPCGALERQVISDFMGEKKLGPFVLVLESCRTPLTGVKTPSDGKAPMLDSDRASKYGLETARLVNCSSEGNFYATTDSAQRARGGIYCHQLADVIAVIHDACAAGQVVIVGAGECCEDDALMVKSGQAATNLDGWSMINFKEACNALFSGKGSTTGKHNNNVTSRGRSVAGKTSFEGEDGLRPPQVKSSTKNQPTVGHQFVALSKVITGADPAEQLFLRSGDARDSRKKRAKRALSASGCAEDEGELNVVEGNSRVGNSLSLDKIKQAKGKAPLDAHVDLHNSAMGGFSGFFGVSKAQTSSTGVIARVGATGYNRAVVDCVILQKAVREAVLHQVGPVAERSFPVDRRVALPRAPRTLAERAGEDDVFAVPSHLNTSASESLLGTGILGAQDKHGHSVALLAELMAAAPLVSGSDKGFDGFRHIAELQHLPSGNMTKYCVDRNNDISGSNFSFGQLQRRRPPRQKPAPLPRALCNSVAISRVIKEANDNALSFSEAMKLVKRDTRGADALLASRALRLLSLAGSAVSNHYAVGAEIPSKLAKRVRSVACLVGLARHCRGVVVEGHSSRPLTLLLTPRLLSHCSAKGSGCRMMQFLAARFTPAFEARVATRTRVPSAWRAERAPSLEPPLNLTSITLTK